MADSNYLTQIELESVVSLVAALDNWASDHDGVLGADCRVVDDNGEHTGTVKYEVDVGRYVFYLDGDSGS